MIASQCNKKSLLPPKQLSTLRKQGAAHVGCSLRTPLSPQQVPSAGSAQRQQIQAREAGVAFEIHTMFAQGEQAGAAPTYAGGPWCSKSMQMLHKAESSPGVSAGIQGITYPAKLKLNVPLKAQATPQL